MQWQMIGSWLVDVACVSLVISGVGALAVLVFRQPVRRLSVIVATLLAILVAPLLSAVPGYPRWRAPLVSLESRERPPAKRDIESAEVPTATRTVVPALAETEIPNITEPVPFAPFVADDPEEFATPGESPREQVAVETEQSLPVASPTVGEFPTPAEAVFETSAGLEAQREDRQGDLVEFRPAGASASPPPLLEVASAAESEGPAVDAEEAEPFAFQLWSVVLLVYAVGALGMLFWNALGWFALQWLIRRSAPADERCQKLLRTIAGGRAEGVKLLVAKRHNRAFTFHYWRPVIVLPKQLIDLADDQPLRWSLAHEWAHVRRRDSLLWSLTRVAVAIHWFNPLVWWLQSQLRISQDYLADAEAAGQGACVEDYAEFLTELASSGVGGLNLGIGMSTRRSELFRRVVMLVDKERRLDAACSRKWVLSLIVLTFLLSASAACWRVVSADDGPAVVANKSKDVAAGKAEAEDKSGRSRLRFAGRRFEEWKEVYETDLDIETKVNALLALRTFGSHGYRDEVVSLLAPVIRQKGSRQLFIKAVDALVILDSAEALGHGLKDGGSYERLYIMGKLSQMGENARPLLPHVLAASNDPSASIRSTVCSIIAAMKASDDKSMDVLDRLIVDEESSVRRAACRAVTSLGPGERQFRVVEKALSDNSENIRDLAVNVLQSFPPSDEVYELLNVAMNDESLSIRNTACYTVGQLKHNSAAAVAILVKGLNEQDPRRANLRWQDRSYSGGRIPLTACLALAELPIENANDRVYSALGTAMKGAHGAVVARLACDILGSLVVKRKSKAAINYLMDGLESMNDEVRTLSVRGLSQLDDDQLYVALERALQNPDVLIRVFACSTLTTKGKSESPKVLRKLLRSCLEDPSAEVRLMAVGALLSLGDKQEKSYQVLIDELQNVDHGERSQAFGLLATFGLNTPKIRTAMLRAIVEEASGARGERGFGFGGRGAAIVGGGRGGNRGLRSRQRLGGPMYRLETLTMLESSTENAEMKVALLQSCLNNEALRQGLYRGHVIHCFSLMGPAAAAAVPQLIQIMELGISPDQDVISYDVMLTVRTLGAIGPTAKVALPTLERLVKDRRVLKVSNDGRLQVAQAIRQIQGK